MTAGKTVLMAVTLMLMAGPAWCQASAKPPQANWWSAPAREDGPTRLVWAGRRTPDTPYTGPNRPLWRIADLLKAGKVKIVAAHYELASGAVTFLT